MPRQMQTVTWQGIVLGLAGIKNRTSRNALQVAVLISHGEGRLLGKERGGPEEQEGARRSSMSEKRNGSERAKERRTSQKYVARGTEEEKTKKKIKEAFPGAELSGSEASGAAKANSRFGSLPACQVG